MVKRFALAALLLTVGACAPSENADTISIAWRFVQTSTGEFDQPNSEVFVVVKNGETRDFEIGAYVGCGSVWDEEKLQEEEALLGASCWFAGGGDDFIVRRTDPDTLTVLYRVVDEGMEEIPEFQKLQELPIPADAVITIGSSEGAL